jgi:hypothetical protein
MPFNPEDIPEEKKDLSIEEQALEAGYSTTEKKAEKKAEKKPEPISSIQK